MLSKRMAMRRMNEMCRRMALTLVFYVLLFHNCQGQSDPTVTIASTQSVINLTDSPQNVSELNLTDITSSPPTDANQATDHSDTPNENTSLLDSTDQQTSTKQANFEATTLKSDVATTVTESHNTSGEPDNSQDNEIDSNSQSENLLEAQPDMDSTTQTPVFVPVLVSGLILAALLIGYYVWKNHCHRKKTGMKLAEESYMADEENQGNTLVSVAPLNPPENQEKPSLNGESLEAVKTQNPPASTNGHSTAKADTEL